MEESGPKHARTLLIPCRLLNEYLCISWPMVLIVDKEHDSTLESDEMEWLAQGSSTALQRAIFVEGKKGLRSTSECNR